jgi:hypothetical protein
MYVSDVRCKEARREPLSWSEIADTIVTGSTPETVRTVLCQAKAKQSESFKYKKRKTIDVMARSSPPIRGVGFEHGTSG